MSDSPEQPMPRINTLRYLGPVRSDTPREQKPLVIDKIAPVLDGKFRGTVFRHADQTVVPSDEWVVFLASDNAFPATLRFYRMKCAEIGAEQEQLDAVDRLIARVDAWRAAHPEKIKLPDAAPGECH